MSAESDRRYRPSPVRAELAVRRRHTAQRRTAQWERSTGLLPWAGAIILFLALGASWYLLPVGSWLGAFRGWIVGLGFEGILLFAALYIVGAVVLAPEALLTIAAGFAYGFWGLPIVLVAATIGASLAFLIARYLARDSVRRLLVRRRNIAAIDQAVADDGWKIVACLRLSPLIPFNLQNYVLGLTAIPFRHYVAATFAGIIPGTALYTYLGMLGNAAGNGGPAKWAFFGAGLLLTVIVIVMVARKAKAKLQQTKIVSELR
jgi:uncharacterized membrane protein YdjX (TVP38/TMEM64 family)